MLPDSQGMIDQALEVYDAIEALELPTYPQEFLEMMRATAHVTLEQNLRELKASETAIHLLEDLVVLNDLQVMFAQGKVESHWNTEAQECVSSIARRVVELGYQFQTPYEE